MILQDPDPIAGDLEEVKPKPVGDPRFHHRESYVIRTVSWLREFAVLPRAGGLNDQDRAWVEDVELYLSMQGQVMREYLEHKKEYYAANPKT